MTETLLRLQGITKRFPGVLANDRVDLEVAAGEIHAVMGENGAGKSTLMSILFGLLQPDEGTIVLDGQSVRLGSPIDAISRGIGMVHQGFRLFETLSVWENVVYGAEPRRGAFVDRRAACRQVAALAERHGLPIDPLARVSDLPVGIRQRLEILKALYRHARILILDEPTAVLTPAETDGLLAILRDLALAGCAVLLITHKLAEVMAASHRVTVLRDGRVTARLVTARTDPAEIIRAMTGRDLPAAPQRPEPADGPIRLSVDRLTVRQQGRRVLSDASFTLRGGEILGVAGVAGNGQSELVESLAGLRAGGEGAIMLDGTPIHGLGVAARRRAGLSYVAEDRHRTATAPTHSARDNLAMGFHRGPVLVRRGLLRRRAMRDWARALIARFAIRIADDDVAAGTLSGGNLQKLVMARELAHDAAVLIAEQPTRGVDVGAIARIHGELRAARDRGQAILLVSSELSEVLALSDRILVLCAGRISAELPRAQANEAVLGLMMAGGAQAA